VVPKPSTIIKQYIQKGILKTTHKIYICFIEKVIQNGAPGPSGACYRYLGSASLDPPGHQTGPKTTPGHQNIRKSDHKAPKIHQKVIPRVHFSVKKRPNQEVHKLFQPRAHACERHLTNSRFVLKILLLRSKTWCFDAEFSNERSGIWCDRRIFKHIFLKTIVLGVPNTVCFTAYVDETERPAIPGRLNH